MNRTAKWIWLAPERHTVDCYLLARREFRLPAMPRAARLEITACDRYRLLVNGTVVGEGPPRSEWPDIYADTYSLDELPLRRGINVLAIILHNTALAQHGQPPGPGGFLAHLAVQCRNGRSINVATNSTWRLTRAPQYGVSVPRRMFPVGFIEVCDLRRMPAGWTDAGFDDSGWPAADVVDSQPAQPYSKVTACPLPRLEIVPTKPAAVGKCGYTRGMRGVTGVPFEFCVFCREDEEFYGASFVWSPKRRQVMLNFGADNRASVFVNNRRVLCQPPPDDTFQNHLYYETDTYAGLYHGHGHRVSQARARLEKGWNSLGVVLGAPHETWGFVLRFADPKTGRTLPLRFSSNRTCDDVPAWQVISDTHLVDGADGMLLDMPPLNAGTFPSPAHLAAWETRRLAAVSGADCLCQGHRGTLKLPPDSFVTYRLPAELVGCIEMDIRGEPGAVLDVTAGEALRPGGCVDSLRDRLFLTDRVILSSTWTRWRSVDRRAMRHIELAARNATRPVEVRNLRVCAMHYPQPAPAEFRCSDKVFNKLWDVGLATMDACTHEQFEDCPIREMGQWLGDALVEGQIAAVAWGDAALTAKALRQFAADQPVKGWIRPMVPCGYGDTLTDYSLMLPYLLHRHWMYWGDRQVLRDCFTGVSRLMNHAATFVDGDGFLRPDPDPKNMILLDHTLSRTTRGLDVITGYQAVYAVGLEHASAVAEVLGQKAKAARWREQRDRLRAAVVGRLFDEDQGLFVNSITGGKHDGWFNATTNYWVLFAGLATPEQDRRMLARLWPSATREPAGLWPPRENPYFKYFVLEVLFSRGMWPEAFAVLRNYYGPMLRRRDAWTLFEMWNPATPPSRPAKTASMCHAYGAGPLVHYFRWVCGIRPTAPGHARVIVEPQLGDLRSLEARVHTPRGEVRMDVRRRAKGRWIVVSAPKGMPLELRSTHLGPGDRLELV